MIRILHVMEATTGGTRRHLRLIAEHVDRDRFELAFACSTLRDARFLDDVESFRRAGLEVLDVPMQRAIRPVADLRAFLRLCRLLWTRDVDIIHTHSSKAGVLGRLAGRLCSDARIVHTPHCFAFLQQAGGGSLRKAFYIACERALGLCTDRLVAVSSEEREAAARYRIAPRERIALLYNGVAEAQPADRVRAERRLRDLGIGPGTPLIGTVGLLNRAKGYAHLLEALPQVLEEFPDLYCLIIGHGELEGELKEHARRAGVASRVVFGGHIEPCADLVAALDVFVMPSLWEGMPYALLEAMALGVPVVASRVGGCPEVIEDGETGLLVEPGDPRGLSQAILALLRDPAARARVGRQGRERVRERFGLKRMIAELEGLYQDLADAPRAARAPTSPPVGA